MTLPFGPLRLMDLAKGDPEKAREIVDDGLDELSKLGDSRRRVALRGRRRLAQFRPRRHGGAAVIRSMCCTLRDPARPRAASMCEVVARLSRKSLEHDEGGFAPPRGSSALRRHRSRALVARDRDFKEIVVSAYGLREGIAACATLPQTSAPRIR